MRFYWIISEIPELIISENFLDFHMSHHLQFFFSNSYLELSEYSIYFYFRHIRVWDIETANCEFSWDTKSALYAIKHINNKVISGEIENSLNSLYFFSRAQR